MVKLHLITGNKGNVGKSVWASGLIEYYRTHKRKLISIDGDNDAQTLMRTYKDSRLLNLSDDPNMISSPDIILDLVEEELLTFEEAEKEKGKGKSTLELSDLVVDLPAAGEKPINKWLQACGLGEDDEPDGMLSLEILKWWVSDSDLESIQLFEKSVAEFPGITHIFLKNMGRTREYQWSDIFSKTNLLSLEKDGKIKIAEIPGLTAESISIAREQCLEMGVAKNAVSVQLSKRLWLRSWLLKVSEVIDKEVNLDKKVQAKKTEAGKEAVSSKASAEKSSASKESASGGKATAVSKGKG